MLTDKQRIALLKRDARWLRQIGAGLDYVAKGLFAVWLMLLILSLVRAAGEATVLLLASSPLIALVWLAGKLSHWLSNESRLP